MKKVKSVFSRVISPSRKEQERITDEFFHEDNEMKLEGGMLQIVEDQDQVIKRSLVNLKKYHQEVLQENGYINIDVEDEQDIIPKGQNFQHIPKESIGFLSIASSRDWNEEFQSAIFSDMKKFREEIITKIQSQVGQSIVTAADVVEQLKNEFIEEALRISQIIISEMKLDDEAKTIPPLKGKGIAGGTKYFHNGLFFKFCSDEYHIYGSIENAFKSASHEIRGLNALFNCFVEGFHFPLMALIDWRGFRMIVSSQLPIDSSTLIYGSDDGGKTIHNKSAEFHEKMKEIAACLNLKGHLCGRKAPQMLYCSADMEGHLGHDKRFYILDTHRLFPCEEPKPDDKYSHLYRLLRPEFVKTYDVPLSGDSFSRFEAQEEKDESRQDIKAATKKLFNEVIPAFATWLDDPTNEETIKNSNICDLLHQRGINLRFMGKVLRRLTSTLVKNILLVEICARAFRILLGQKFRDIEDNHEISFKEAVIDLLNKILTEETNFMAHFKRSIEIKFEESFQRNIDLETTPFNPLEQIDLVMLKKRLEETCGIQFRENIVLQNGYQLKLEDIQGVHPTKKTINFISYMKAVSEGERASNFKGETGILALKKVLNHWDEIIAKEPDNIGALNNRATVLLRLARKTPDISSQKKLLEVAAKVFQDLSPKFPLSLVNLSICYRNYYKLTGDLEYLIKAKENLEKYTNVSDTRLEYSYNSLGLVFLTFADIVGCESKPFFYQKAIENFTISGNINPNAHATINLCRALASRLLIKGISSEKMDSYIQESQQLINSMLEKSENKIPRLFLHQAFSTVYSTNHMIKEGKEMDCEKELSEALSIYQKGFDVSMNLDDSNEESWIANPHGYLYHGILFLTIIHFDILPDRNKKYLEQAEAALKHSLVHHPNYSASVIHTPFGEDICTEYIIGLVYFYKASLYPDQKEKWLQKSCEKISNAIAADSFPHPHFLAAWIRSLRSLYEIKKEDNMLQLILEKEKELKHLQEDRRAQEQKLMQIFEKELK